MSDVYEFCPAYLFAADPDGRLLHVSRALRDHMDTALPEDAELSALGQPEDAEALAGLVAALAEGEASRSCSIHVAAQGQTQLMRCQVRRAEDGTLHGALDHETRQARIERRLLRTAMETLDIVMHAIDAEGTFVFHDGKALASAGLVPNQFVGANVFDLYPAEILGSTREALAGTPSHSIAEAHGQHWESWNVPLRNEAGEVEYCVSLSLDITQNVRTRLELERQLQTIAEQQEALQELSTPLIEVWDRVLTVPLVGTIHDPARVGALSEQLLDRVARTDVRFVILDLTGVENIDTGTASDVMRIVRSLGLLGSEGMLTGISPVVAQTLVSLGIDLSAVTIQRTLRDGLRYCTSMLHH